MSNEYVPTLVTIKEIRKETNNTNTYIFQYKGMGVNKDFIWIPGQFLMISVFGIGESAISLSDIEKDGFINLTIRNVGNVTGKICTMKQGDFFGVRGPYGKGWPLRQAKGKDIVVVAGGMGIAPLRGLINYINLNRTDYNNLEIIYGARTPEDLIFKYEFKKWKRIKNCILHLTADTIIDQPLFECQTGLVTSCFPRMKTHHRNAIAFICGPEIMMRYAAKCMETIGFKDTQIFLSLERRMKCGIGKCGHCQIGTKFVCKDGPIFNYADIKPFMNPI